MSAPKHGTHRAGPMVTVVAGVAIALGGCATTEGGGGSPLDGLKDVAGGLLGGGGDGAVAGLSTSDIVAGLKQALTTGSETVVGQLGQTNGFDGDPRIRIPLPASLEKARDVASRFGLGGRFDDLETKLNRAAEAATPKARDLFVGAIRSMSVEDARGILQGPDDAATTYFRGKTGTELQAEMRPIVDGALGEVGAVSSFNALASRYNAIPGVPTLDADLTGYVVDEGMDGIFTYLADEEKAIRENPVKRTSEILQRVFGSR